MKRLQLTNASVTLDNGVIVQRYNIPCSRIWCYKAYEPATPFGQRVSHGSVMSISDRWYGDVDTRNVSAHIPPTMARALEHRAEVNAFLEARRAESRAYIQQAFPEAVVSKWGDMEIVANHPHWHANAEVPDTNGTEGCWWCEEATRLETACSPG